MQNLAFLASLRMKSTESFINETPVTFQFCSIKPRLTHCMFSLTIPAESVFSGIIIKKVPGNIVHCSLLKIELCIAADQSKCP